MATKRQGPDPHGKVVSVRLDSKTIERLDKLAERTGRSRGMYLREAIRALLPHFERASWGHVMPRIEDGEDDEFHSIVENLFEHEGYRRRETEDGY